MSNSKIRACACNSPRFAIKYRNPNAQCAYSAFNVVRMMSGMLAANYVTATARSNARITPTTWKPARTRGLFLVKGREMELLSTHAGLKHQAAFGYREHHHALLVLCVSGRALSSSHRADPGAHGPLTSPEVVQ